MSYIERVLQPDEQVLYRTHLHWILFAPVAAIGGLLLVCAIVVQALSGNWWLGGGMAVLGLLVAGSLAFAAWLDRITTEIAVTDARVLVKRGLIRRDTQEMHMSKIESVEVSQSVWGRLLGYGTVVLRGTGAGLNPLLAVDDPIELRNRIVVR